MEASEMTKWRDGFLAAAEKGDPKPVLAGEFQGASMDDAYEVQRALVAEFAKQDQISGYKAAMSSKAVQQAQGLDSALYGVLFKSGEYRAGDDVDSGRFRRCMMETEIGYLVRQPVTEVPDMAALPDLVSPIPMVEFAEVGYSDQKAMRPLDLVAGNSASACYLVGQAGAPIDPNDVTVSLTLGQQTLYEGKGRDAMDDQWFAVRWLIESVLGAGYDILPGHFLMTGALGRPMPCQPGSYRADYGDFGSIDFLVK
ncbi:MAG: hypothetical protein O2780_13025 [Proteobacteria bacterium]|jgi:2-keto-4-pentenoate hydratase|nr:hypothetical protein [Pseudomonadota bacterium]MDA1302269.1 hypothetical protein [Pseudomonadota bacterium]